MTALPPRPGTGFTGTGAPSPAAHPKSCANCPSKLSAAQSVAYFGKSIGSSMCAQYGTVLDRPGFTSEETRSLQKKIAAPCKRFGEPQPDKGSPNTIFAPIIADPLMFDDDESIPGAPTYKAAAATCTSCMFYMPPQQVLTDYGWNAGICQRKGSLVPSNMTRQIAVNCDVSIMGQMVNFPVNLRELYTPEYHHVDIFAAYGAGVVHPLQHVTDKPLTPEETAEGILAWRKITDPDNEERFTFLPIYNPSHFPVTEIAKIPQPGDDEHPELYLDHGNNLYKIAVLWRELDETPMAWGPGGVGKTEIARHLAYLMQLPFERFSITASTELDDLIGKMLFEHNETVFQKGRLPLAWEKPSVLLLDEPNTAPPDVWQLLRPLTDNSKQLVLDTASGERVSRHKHAYLMMAANPSYDSKNVGTNTIGDADASRLMHLRFGLPPAELEKKIIAKRVSLDGWEIDKEQLRLLMVVATDIRNLSESGSLTTSWGIRHQIKVARALKWFSPAASYQLATDDLPPDEAETVMDSVRSAFGDDSSKSVLGHDF